MTKTTNPAPVTEFEDEPVTVVDGTPLPPMNSPEWPALFAALKGDR